MSRLGKMVIGLFIILGFFMMTSWVYYNFKNHFDKRIMEAKAVVKTYYS